MIKNPLIPTILIDKKFVTDIRTKTNIFNKFFTEQCTAMKNDFTSIKSGVFDSRKAMLI